MRDLIGYGGKAPDITWPNGARLAISLVVNFEEGAEQQVGDGDAATERIGEVLSVVDAGRPRHGPGADLRLRHARGVVAVPRCARRRQLPATFFCCGRAIERVPMLARGDYAARPRAGLPRLALAARTPTIAAREEEAADLDRCISITQRRPASGPTASSAGAAKASGPRDCWPSAAFSTRRNAFDDDLPYWDRGVRGRPLLVVPYALDSNDMKFFHPNGFCRSAEFVSYVEDALDVLLAEADRGKSRLLNLGFHLRISGRPARFQAAEQIMDLVRRLGSRAWIARRIDIAKHAMTCLPAA